jgi:lipoprotein-anchoring transpeptidase ErfK/SrfK
MSFMRIKSALCLGAALLVPTLLYGCGKSPQAQVDLPAQPPVAAAPPVTIELRPAAESAAVPLSTEVGVAVQNADLASVTLKDAAGVEVAGSLRADKSSWVPNEPLRPETRYVATAVAGDQTKTTEFTTMAAPASTVDTGLYLFDNEEYGVAMPVVVEFTQDVEPEARAGVEQRLFVTTTPPQAGAWSWSSSRQVQYRAENYWQPGTTIQVRAGLTGHPLGAGKWGDTDRRATVRIAQNKVELVIDNLTKHMTVLENSVPTRSMPVSLGKASTPSSYGTMVIMEKKAQTVFDTTGEPGDQYRADVSYAQRLTWGGEFIHAAPWSVGDQGVNNVSHGCVNMSWGDAEWLFGVTHVGDPVTVSGTEVALQPGNGFTAWNQSWEEHLKGSALPAR